MHEIVVKFGVEKEVERGYGYKELYLTYDGEAIPYKAVVKDGRLVAILSRRYTLIPNEEILSELSKFGDVNVLVNDKRLVAFVDLKNGVRAIVTNSIDGTLSLRVGLVIRVGDVDTFILSDEFANVRHFGNVEDKFRHALRNLSRQDIVKKYEERINELARNDVTVSWMRKVAEEVCGKDCASSVYLLYKFGRIKSLHDLYVELLRNIHNGSSSIVQKIKKIDKLNKLFNIY